MDALIKKYNSHTTSFFDLYGGSFFLSISITLIFFILISYFYSLSRFEEIKNDWDKERCKPTVMPFAGIIRDDLNDDNITANNFKECMRESVGDVSEYALKPMMTIFANVLNVKSMLLNSSNIIKNRLNDIHNAAFGGAGSIKNMILSRFGSVLIPLQLMIMYMKDTLNKVQGSMMAVIQFIGGTMFMLRDSISFMRKMLLRLIAFVARTVLELLALALGLALSLQFIPAVAAGVTAQVGTVVLLILGVFSAIFMPYIDALVNATSTSLESTGCFDENTHIPMANNKIKKISKIEPGEKMRNGSIVTSVMKVDAANIDMYLYNGVYVSQYHRVKIATFDKNTNQHNIQYIPVCKLKDAKRVHHYKKAFIFCINTTSKEIEINNTIFTDWDDLDKDELFEIQSNTGKYLYKKELNKVLDGGFHKNTVLTLNNGNKIKISDIEPGMYLQDNSKITAVVKMRAEHLPLKVIEIKPNETICLSQNTDDVEFNDMDDMDDMNDDIKKKEMINSSNVKYVNTNKKVVILDKFYKEKYLYHLVTDTGYLHIHNLYFKHYNDNMEKFL